MKYYHKSVLLSECIESLNIIPHGFYVDGTAGGGGHSEEIAKRLDNKGKLICIDQDPDSVSTVKNRLKNYSFVTVAKANFCDMDKVLHSISVESVDGILLDLGVSSYQLDQKDRGFSYHSDSPLDMRMSKEGICAYDLVNNMSLKELTNIIRTYGEEKYAKNIALSIIRYREKNSIKTTLELAEIVKSSVPSKAMKKGHPARKTFQAIRIAVNDELTNLSKGLEAAFSLLKPSGRLLVITFHSLEDRIVKNKMKSWCEGCTCPKDFPICVCNNTPKAKLLYKKPITPSTEEINANPRSRSSKLRGCIRSF